MNKEKVILDISINIKKIRLVTKLIYNFDLITGKIL